MSVVGDKTPLYAVSMPKPPDNGNNSENLWKKGGKSPNPLGRPRKNQLVKQVNLDGWINILTGLGISTHDKRLGAGFLADRVTDEEALQYWLGNDIAARIIEAIPEEMLRAGWELKIKSEDEEGGSEGSELTEDVAAISEELGMNEIFEKALKYERAYGGAAILPVVNDGSEDLASPFNLDGVMSLSHFMVFEPRELFPETWYEDPLEPKYSMPETYRLTPVSQGVSGASQFLIHESRMIIFPGIVVSRRQRSQRPGWGESVLTRVNSVLRDYGVAWDSVAAILQDFAQAVFKFKGLSQILAEDDMKTFENRLKAMDLARSVLRGLALDTEDEYVREGTPLAGIPEILEKFATRVATAADIPLTVLMGTSPAGLNATGESDRALWHDRIARAQKIKLMPRLEQALKILFRARTVGPEQLPGIGNGAEPEVWSIEFCPLWQPTEKDKAETRKLVAETDAIYLDRGVLLPAEVAIERFGGDGYSGETQIEVDTRKKMLYLEQQQQQPANVTITAQQSVTSAEEGEE